MVVRHKNLLDAFTASALDGRPIIGGKPPIIGSKPDAKTSAAGTSASKPARAEPIATDRPADEGDATASHRESVVHDRGAATREAAAPARERDALAAERDALARDADALSPDPDTLARDAALRRELSSLRRALGEPAMRILAVLGVAALIAAFWLGRSSGGEASAGDTAQLATSGPGVLLRPGANVVAPKDGDLGKVNQTTAQIGTTHDQAFMDARHQFTVRVVQYKDDEAGRKAGRATQDYLRREGYPVITPIVIGKNLIVCVGYAAKYGELEQLTAFVQALRGPDDKAKKPPFDSAYIVNIDDVVQR